MFRPRVIPALLLKDKGLVKTVRFNKEKASYIGDPLNAVKIFNDKYADELIFLDITASRNRKRIDTELVRKIGEECNMPFGVGGGIRNLEDIRELLNAGAEKVVINTYAAENPVFIKQASEKFGSSAIVVCVDVKKNFTGQSKIYIYGGDKSTKYEVESYVKMMDKMGCGEIILNSIDLDGTMAGYDLDMIKKISLAVSVPVIALGGAGSTKHFCEAVSNGASAVAAGSLFVFHGKQRAVLISFPTQKELRELFVNQYLQQDI
jgi:imidazole glycerol-phosphate synthase subunit HisF